MARNKRKIYTDLEKINYEEYGKLSENARNTIADAWLARHSDGYTSKNANEYSYMTARTIRRRRKNEQQYVDNIDYRNLHGRHKEQYKIPY